MSAVVGVRSNEIGSIGGSHQKQRDSWRLAATNKNPRNLFGLEASKIARKSRLPCLRDIASRHFKMSKMSRGTGLSSTGQSGTIDAEVVAIYGAWLISWFD